MSSKSESIATDGEANPTQVPKLRFPEFVDTEGWESKRLGSVGELTRGLTYSSADVVSAGLLVLRSTNIQDGSLVLDKDLVFVDKPIPRALRLQAGDIVICMSNGSKTLVGKSGEYFGEHEGDITVGAFCSFFRPMLPFAKFAFHLGSYQAYIANLIAGGSINNLTNFVLEEFIFQVPRLAAEQQKIANCLSSLDELIAAQARKVDALKTHKKGLMQQLFPREGETQPRLRFYEFRNGEEWGVATLADACRMQAGKFVAAADILENNTDELFPCYGGNGLRGFTAKYTHEGDYPLIGRQGALCGNIKFASGRFYATEHAVVATPDHGVEVVWLYYVLDLLNLNRFATGQAQPGLSVDVLEKVPVKIPRDKGEQQRIASCLSSVDALITLETQKLETLKTHKKGLMQQLFPSPDEATA